MNLKAICLTICSLAFVPAVSGAVLYDQPLVWAGNGTPVGGSYTIEYSATDNYGFRTHDDFTLSSSASITSVTWYAMAYDYVTAANNPVTLDSPLGYEISFYANDSDAPSTLLHSESAAAGDVTVSLVGTGTFGVPVNLYQFTYEFATPFEAVANTRYWFAPLLQTATFAPNIAAWVRGTGGNNLSYRVGLGTAPGPDAIAADRAFALEGQFVPEPGSYALVSGALAALYALSRRRA